MILTFYRFGGSIAVLLWIAMLLACKNDIHKVNEFSNMESQPGMSGEDLTLIYSDSAIIKYKIITPEYLNIVRDDEQFDEFPKGVLVISYDEKGNVAGSIKANYAIKKEKENIWEARDEVVVTNADGTKLETELLFWDMNSERIFSPRYSRLTMTNNIIEGNEGFESDQELKNPVFEKVTGSVEFNME